MGQPCEFQVHLAAAEGGAREGGELTDVDEARVRAQLRSALGGAAWPRPATARPPRHL
jgi:hypothetical protein